MTAWNGNLVNDNVTISVRHSSVLAVCLMWLLSLSAQFSMKQLSFGWKWTNNKWYGCAQSFYGAPYQAARRRAVPFRTTFIQKSLIKISGRFVTPNLRIIIEGRGFFCSPPVSLILFIEKSNISTASSELIKQLLFRYPSAKRQKSSLKWKANT